MKLYGSYSSPIVRHCRIVLAQCCFNFDFIEIDHETAAKKSPTAKVPFFTVGDLTLTDSSSILKYIREKYGMVFLDDLADFEKFTMVNTLLDSTINLFLLEIDNLGPAQSEYLVRQQNRITSGLKALNSMFDPKNGIVTDSALRCVCFIDWALFRKRINIAGLDNLQGLLDAANQVEEFTATSPANIC